MIGNPATWGPSGHCQVRRHRRCMGMVAVAWPVESLEVAIWACPCACHQSGET